MHQARDGTVMRDQYQGGPVITMKGQYKIHDVVPGL
jgi:hypothetical protein